MKRVHVAIAAVAPLVLCAAAHASQTVYSTTFESGVAGPEWSGAGSVQSAGGLSAFGFGAWHLRNDTASPSVLTLTGLAPHAQVTVSFSLAMWDSIDWGDLFRMTADSATVFDEPFGNYFTPSGQAEGPGVRITPDFIDFSNPDYGYNPINRDSARLVSFTFPHSGPSLTLAWDFRNTQGGLDESFGLDNVVVVTNAIPEPGTWLLMALGVAAVGAAVRRGR